MMYVFFIILNLRIPAATNKKNGRISSKKTNFVILNLRMLLYTARYSQLILKYLVLKLRNMRSA